MKEIVREAWLGQILRVISANRLFKYPEEEDGFHWLMLVSTLIDVEKRC
jgi:hypothetical protein